MGLREDDDLVIQEDEIEMNDTEQVDEEVIVDSDPSEEANPETIQDEDDEEDRIVTIGDAPPEEEEEVEPSADRTIVKKLRKTLRGYEKKNKALLKQIEENERAATESKPVELGPEPELKDYNYDDKKFRQAVIEWDRKKLEVEQREAEARRLVEEQNKAHQAKMQRYVESKQTHKFKDFDDAEDIVKNTLNVTQQGILVEGAKDAALLTYALGKNPKKLEELAKNTNHIEFAFELARIEEKLKVSNRKAPSPEKRIKSGSSGGSAGNVDHELERLREKAAKSGDMTELVAYKTRLKRQKQKG